MNFIYTLNCLDTICSHEQQMFKVYSHLINNYRPIAEKYNCIIEVKLIWSNFFNDEIFEERPPFGTGYECYIGCDILRDGKVVRIESYDDVADYYDLSTGWQISFITRHFFKKMVYLCDAIDDVEDDLKYILSQLS